MLEFTYKRNNLTETAQFEKLVELKFPSLEKYWTATAARCEIEFEKVAAKRAGKIFRVEANLIVDGTLYRAEATEENFEKAVDEVRNELDKILRRSKAKDRSLLKKGGQFLKQMMRRPR